MFRLNEGVPSLAGATEETEDRPPQLPIDMPAAEAGLFVGGALLHAEPRRSRDRVFFLETLLYLGGGVHVHDQGRLMNVTRELEQLPGQGEGGCQDPPPGFVFCGEIL